MTLLVPVNVPVPALLSVVAWPDTMWKGNPLRAYGLPFSSAKLFRMTESPRPVTHFKMPVHEIIKTLPNRVLKID